MEQETLFHLIALGDKAADTLLKLRSDLDEWFETELLSHNKYHYLVALIDEYASPNDLPRVDIDETGKLIVFVIDISDEPRAKEWGNVLSYIWIPKEGQYGTVKDLFQIVCRDSLLVHGLISFDFKDWRKLASGANTIKISTLHLDESSVLQLDEWPVDCTTDGKYLIVLGSPTFQKTQMDEYTKGLNTLYNRLPSDVLTYWTIVGKELAKEVAYIALIQLCDLAN